MANTALYKKNYHLSKFVGKRISKQANIKEAVSSFSAMENAYYKMFVKSQAKFS